MASRFVSALPPVSLCHLSLHPSPPWYELSVAPSQPARGCRLPGTRQGDSCVREVRMRHRPLVTIAKAILILSGRRSLTMGRRYHRYGTTASLLAALQGAISWRDPHDEAVTEKSKPEIGCSSPLSPRILCPQACRGKLEPARCPWVASAARLFPSGGLGSVFAAYNLPRC